MQSCVSLPRCVASAGIAVVPVVKDGGPVGLEGSATGRGVGGWVHLLHWLAIVLWASRYLMLRAEHDTSSNSSEKFSTCSVSWQDAPWRVPLRTARASLNPIKQARLC